MAKVAIIRCKTYDCDIVKKAVESGMQLLGGPGRLVRIGERILLKPNLLVPEVPEKCVTTHPAVFKAVAEVLLSGAAAVNYGDSTAAKNCARKAPWS